MHRLLLVVGLMTALPAGEALAQDDGPARHAAGTIGAGSVIRIRQTSGHVITGRFRSASGNEIVMDTGAVVHVPAETIDSIWRGGRAAGRGAKTGAIAGGISGAVALAALAAIVVEGLCETDDCNSGGAAVVGGLIGAAGGAGAGALLGGIIGAGVPTWKLVYPSDSGTRRALAPARPDRPTAGGGQIGALRAGLSLASGTDRSNHGAAAGGRISFLPRFSRNLWGGIEVATQDIGGWRAERLGVTYDVNRHPQMFVYIEDASIRVVQLAATARLGVSHGPVRPYGVLSAGVNLARMQTRSIVDCPTCPATGEFPPAPGLSSGWSSHPGASIGAGVDLLPGASNLSVGLEARMHSYPRFVSFALTVGTGW